MQDPHRFLFHDINFHRSLAAASGNPIVASLVEMVSALYCERRRRPRSGRQSAICETRLKCIGGLYQAVRSRDHEAARLAMNEHLVQASRHQARTQRTSPAGRLQRSQRRPRSAGPSTRLRPGPSTGLRADPSTPLRAGLPRAPSRGVQPEGDVRTDGFAV